MQQVREKCSQEKCLEKNVLKKNAYINLKSLYESL